MIDPNSADGETCTMQRAWISIVTVWLTELPVRILDHLTYPDFASTTREVSYTRIANHENRSRR
jgi:hypothetical protein